MWIVGHRGASGHTPENTLASFRRAVELGATFIETDVQLSRDARVVAIHDETLDRTTNGHGPVQRYTLAELRELDAGSWFDPQFAGERIPTFEEILCFAAECDVVFYLEIKQCATWGVEHALVGALQEAQQAARAVVLSFDLRRLETVRRIEPMLMTGYLFDKPTEAVVERAVQAGARQLAPRADLVTPELVQAARRADLQMVTWTVNEPDAMRALAAAGVNGIMTDYPERLVDVQRETSQLGSS